MTFEVRARGATLPEVFAQAALGLLARACEPGAIEERDVREVRAHGDSVEALLAHFLGECLYVLEVEGFAWRRVAFAVFEADSRAGAEPMRLHSFLHGQTVASESSPDIEPIAPVTAQAIRLRTVGSGYEVAITT